MQERADAERLDFEDNLTAHSTGPWYLNNEICWILIPSNDVRETCIMEHRMHRVDHWSMLIS